MVSLFTDLQTKIYCNQFFLENCIKCIIVKETKFFQTSPLFEKANIFTVHELSMIQLLQYATDSISAFSTAVKIKTRSSKLDLFEQKMYRKQIMKLSIEHQKPIKLLNCMKNQKIWDADLGIQCTNLRKKAFRIIV